MVDLQFSDVANRVEAEARAQVTSLEALRISHCVGYSLGSLISAARQTGARIDGPDFQLQHAVLARVHAKWLSDTNEDGGGGGSVPNDTAASSADAASPLGRPFPSVADRHKDLGPPRWSNIQNGLSGSYHVIYTAPIVVDQPRAAPRAALAEHRYGGPIGGVIDPAAPHRTAATPEPAVQGVRTMADQMRLAVQIRAKRGLKPPPPSPPGWPARTAITQSADQVAQAPSGGPPPAPLPTFRVPPATPPEHMSRRSPMPGGKGRG